MFKSINLNPRIHVHKNRTMKDPRDIEHEKIMDAKASERYNHFSHKNTTKRAYKSMCEDSGCPFDEKEFEVFYTNLLTNK